MHSAFLTKDAAIKSTSCSTPNFKSSLSFSVIAGRRIGTFGTLTPLRSPSSPPLSTVQIISVSVFSRTVSSMSPSSIRIFLPIWTSSTRPPYVIETFVLSPSISFVVSTNLSPASRLTFLPPFNTPVRISGPFVSSRMATGFFSSSRIFLSISILDFCSSWSPWEKLNLAISMPFWTSLLISPASFVFGPIVQMIFVFFIVI